MGTPFKSGNSNVGKQDKLVHRGKGIMSDSGGQNSATGDMATVKRVAGGPVEGGSRPSGHVSKSGRVVNGGPQDQLRRKGSSGYAQG